MLEPKIEIDHIKLLNNVNKIKNRLDNNVKMMAVVKSNAYGHGMNKVSCTLEKHVDMFGVGYLEEALVLCKTIKKDILIMGPVYDFDIVMKHNFVISLESVYQFNALIHFYGSNLKGTDKKLRVHINIDTGMHRFGVSLAELSEILNILDNKYCHNNIIIEGAFSHFASTVNQHIKLVDGQYKIFKKAKTYLKNHYDGKLIYHIANSENALDTHKYNENMVRIGNGLYGGMFLKNPVKTERIGKIFLPIMSIHVVKEKSGFGYGFKSKAKAGTRLGTVKTGFYEGMGMYKLPIGVGTTAKIKSIIKRVLKLFIRKEKVLYNSMSLPIVGMVNMQFFQIDLTGTDIMVGDFVELTKEPLFYDDSVKRVHLLEGKDEVNY